MAVMAKPAATHHVVAVKKPVVRISTSESMATRMR
jgi:hypothetical protein